jgi:hypothetical protein
MVATYWLADPAAETAVRLAGLSRDPEVRAKVARGRETATPGKDSKNE